MPADTSNPDKVVITHGDAAVEVYLWGATVTSWRYKGVERLFLSSKAILDGTKAIRGGIPLVFPQFGASPGAPLPQHGFARVSRWDWIGLTVDNAAETTVQFGLRPAAIPAAQKALWPHACDIGTVSVAGLTGCAYVDKVANGARTESEPRAAVTMAMETDRVYERVKNDHLSIEGTGLGAGGMAIHKMFFNDVVVWNPWTEKAKAMADFGDDEFTQMVCVEVGNVSAGTLLRAGEEWEGGQVLTAF
ncbi:galactose mutarotase-like domain-containing protein [Entophlyctis helioformis]|nr:galactose mutarotase-like domain-containing protein [Entophlyctis helioformis]